MAADNTNFQAGQSAWDMRASYFDTVAMALQLAFQARIVKRTAEWFDILDGIYARVMPLGCQDDEIENMLEDVADKIYGQRDSADMIPEELEHSEAIEDLRKLEKKLIQKMHENNLLVPKRGDPSQIWADQGGHG